MIISKASIPSIKLRTYQRPSVLHYTRTLLSSTQKFQRVLSGGLSTTSAFEVKANTRKLNLRLTRETHLRSFLAARPLCLETLKMDSIQPGTAETGSTNAIGSPRPDGHTTPSLPASLEDYAFPTSRLRTLNDATKTPLVLMACGSCQSRPCLRTS
jgi:hypothetical protein